MSPNVASQDQGSLCAPASPPTRRRWVTTVLLVAVLLPAILSFGILFRQSLFVPYQDDYNAILAFAIDYKHLPNLSEKVLDIAAAQHNEYKLGFEHAVVASELELDHHLNFTFLVVLGDCFLIGIGYLLWKIYSPEGMALSLRLRRFLPISLLFFSLTYWENLNWAMTGLQNTPVIFFSLLGLYLLIPLDRSLPGLPRMIAACVVSALAAFTSANGFLLALVGLLFLLPRRAYGRSLMWCASFVVPFAAYLYHYRHAGEQPLSRFHLITRPFFFVAFLGGVIPYRWIALLVGFVMLGIILLASRSRFDRINPVGLYSAAWAITTGLLVAWVRGAASFGVASRYSFYSILLLIFCYSFVEHFFSSRLSETGRRRFYTISLVFAFGFWFTANASAYRALGARRQMVLKGIEFYRAAPGTNSPMIDPLVEKAFPNEKAFEQVVLTKAIEEGVYALPPKPRIHE